MAEVYYDSRLTGAQLDEAFAGMTKLQDSVAQAEADAATAQRYGQIVEQNARAIGDIEENLSAIKAAPANAQAAANSASAAASSASAAGQSKQSAAASAESARNYAEQAQQIAQGALGWYATDADLKSAHPTGQNGQWAIIGSTDTIWTWDSDTDAWKNTSVKTDLSNYYTKSQTDGKYLTKASVLNLIYPVGSIYMSITNVSPATFIGGTWQRIQDVFLLAAGNTYSAGSTGGEASHALTSEENGPHTHAIYVRLGIPGNTSMEAITASAYDYASPAEDVSMAASILKSSGSGQAHNNMPPYLAVYMWKRTA